MALNRRIGICIHYNIAHLPLWIREGNYPFLYSPLKYSTKHNFVLWNQSIGYRYAKMHCKMEFNTIVQSSRRIFDNSIGDFVLFSRLLFFVVLIFLCYFRRCCIHFVFYYLKSRSLYNTYIINTRFKMYYSREGHWRSIIVIKIILMGVWNIKLIIGYYYHVVSIDVQQLREHSSVRFRIDRHIIIHNTCCTCCTRHANDVSRAIILFLFNL